jgi:thioester reductase-like protein
MSSQGDNLKLVVQKLVELDEEEQRYKNLLNEIKDKKEEVSDILMNMMVSNNIQNKDIILNGKKIKYLTTRTQETVTKKLINDKLELYFNDKKKANEVTQFIYEKRNVITKNALQIKKIN